MTIAAGTIAIESSNRNAGVQALQDAFLGCASESTGAAAEFRTGNP
jgi:hypothetical protein